MYDEINVVSIKQIEEHVKDWMNKVEIRIGEPRHINTQTLGRSSSSSDEIITEAYSGDE